LAIEGQRRHGQVAHRHERTLTHAHVCRRSDARSCARTHERTRTRTDLLREELAVAVRHEAVFGKHVVKLIKDLTRSRPPRRAPRRGKCKQTTRTTVVSDEKPAVSTVQTMQEEYCQNERKSPCHRAVPPACGDPSHRRCRRTPTRQQQTANARVQPNTKVTSCSRVAYVAA
jgi:hypothetical protein